MNYVVFPQSGIMIDLNGIRLKSIVALEHDGQSIGTTGVVVVPKEESDNRVKAAALKINRVLTALEMGRTYGLTKDECEKLYKELS